MRTVYERDGNGDVRVSAKIDDDGNIYAVDRNGDIRRAGKVEPWVENK